MPITFHPANMNFRPYVPIIVDMATPKIYKNLALRMADKRHILWQIFAMGFVLCVASLVYAYFPIKTMDINPGLRLAMVVVGAAVGAEISLLTCGLICIEFWFRGGIPLSAEERRRTFLGRLGGTGFGFSEWYASIAMLSLLVFCIGLAVGIVKFGIIPILSMTL